MASDAPGPAAHTRIFGREAPLAQPRRGYRFGPENLVFGDLVDGATARTVLDLGAGCGVLGLVAAARVSVPPRRVTLVERNPEMAAWSRHNAARTLGTEAVVLEQDLREATLPSAELIVANPPWFAPGAGRPSRHATTREATHAHHGDVFDFVAAGASALADGGTLWLVVPDDGTAEAIEAGGRAGLHLREVVRVYARHHGRGHRVWTAWSTDGGRCRIRSLSALTRR